MNKLFLILIVLTALYSCKQDNQYDYPLVFTGEVTDIDSTGATFHGKITDLGNEEILEYGFVWDIYGTPTITNSSKCTLDKGASVNVFSQCVSSDLKSNTDYYVRAYIQTNQTVVYGKSVKFTAKGFLSPVIYDFNPKIGSEGTQVIINGANFNENLSKNIITFGQLKVTADSATGNKLVVNLPSNLKISGYVNIKLKISDKMCVSSDSFFFEGAYIKNYTKGPLMGSDLMSIDGDGFIYNGQEPIVKLGNYSLSNISFTNNTILCVVPYDIIAGEYTLSVTSNNKACFTNSDINIYSPWKYQNVTHEVFNRAKTTGIVINDCIYSGFGQFLGSGDYTLYNDLWAYNPSNAKWKKCADLPSDTRQSPISFSANGKGYFGFGDRDVTIKYNDLWEYDPEANEWTQKSSFPKNPLPFAYCQLLGEKAYIGFDFSNEFWEYNIPSDKWTQKNNLPNGKTIIKASFSLNEFGYFLLGQNDFSNGEFWQYNPNSDTWIRKKDFAGNGRYYAKGFSINDFGYIGFMDRNMGLDYSDLWRYSEKNDLWTRVPDIPTKSGYSTQVFSFNDYVYVLFGVTDQDAGQLWKFYPNQRK